MPLEPPCTSKVSPGLQPAALEHIGPDGEEGFGQGRRLDHRQARRAGQALRRRGRAVFGIAAAGHQGADLVADFAPAGHAGADRDDRARDLQARACRWRPAAADSRPAAAARPAGSPRPRRAISTSPCRASATGRYAGTSTSGPPGDLISIAHIVSGRTVAMSVEIPPGAHPPGAPPWATPGSMV